eukprot:TRINITY_DN115402_c0_g1_i1.p1 TRINITY_DN115402_c0_g1~~TRINITY_DN115402_c0_g1_i1.p1  ORF type:complete len:339 (+),score=56.86 TRINITY_DN115402_c0_g1_i1:145-1017(+)
MAATELIGKREIFENEEYVQELFGNLLRSMFTMFQLMTMDTWADTIARPVLDLDFSMSLFFVAFIGIGVFVFWNLITAIIVENAFAIAQKDSSNQAREIEIAKKQELAALTELFLEIDTDGSGELTSAEFFGALKNKKVRQMLDVLEIQPSELEEVWDVLDDGDGLLTIKEFTSGMRRMRGNAKAKDMADTLKRLRTATATTAELKVQADQFAKQVDSLEVEIARIADDTARMLGLFHEMFHRLDTYSKKIGKENASRQKAQKDKFAADQEEAHELAYAKRLVEEANLGQ